MITTYDDSPRFWQRTWFLALLLGVAVGTGIWWWQTQSGSQTAAPAEAQAAAKPKARKVSAEPESALLVPPTVGDDGRPSDFTAEEWAALKDAMAKTPNPRAELERVVKYLRFQKAFEQWQSLQEGPDALTRRRLAEKLIEQLPERVAQVEVTCGEGLLLQASLMADIEPNEGMRQQRIEQMGTKLCDAGPAAIADPRDPEYKRREAAIVAAYQALPEARRDPTQLTKDLDAARIAIYGSKK
jgi:hypothetical protein